MLGCSNVTRVRVHQSNCGAYGKQFLRKGGVKETRPLAPSAVRTRGMRTLSTPRFRFWRDRECNMKFNLIKGNTLKRVSPLIFCSHDATRSSWKMLRTPAIDCMRRALGALPRPRRVHSRCTCGPSPVTRTCPRTSPGWPRAPRPAPHRLGPLPLHVPSGDLLLSFRDQLAQPPGRDLGLRPSPSPPPAPSTRSASI